MNARKKLIVLKSEDLLRLIGMNLSSAIAFRCPSTIPLAILNHVWTMVKQAAACSRADTGGPNVHKPTFVVGAVGQRWYCGGKRCLFMQHASRSSRGAAAPLDGPHSEGKHLR
jgi:hypothetical protein